MESPTITQEESFITVMVTPVHSSGPSSKVKKSPHEVNNNVSNDSQRICFIIAQVLGYFYFPEFFLSGTVTETVFDGVDCLPSSKRMDT